MTMNPQDLFQNPKGNTAQSVLIGAFLATVTALSALTSGLFFARFVPSLGALFTNPLYAFAVAFLTGVILLDIAALSWLYIARRDAVTSTEQISIANAAAFALLILSMSASAAYLILTSKFVVDADLLGYTNIAGLLIVTAALLINFAATFGYSRYSPTAKEKALTAAMRAHMRESAYAAMARRMKEREEALLQEIVTRNQDVLEADFVAAMTGRSLAGDGKTPAAPKNGREADGFNFAREVEEVPFE